MKVKLEKIDLRSDNGSTTIEDEHGNTVGQYLYGASRGRNIIMLGKYSGWFETQQECEAFVEGDASWIQRVCSIGRFLVLGCRIASSRRTTCALRISMKDASGIYICGIVHRDDLHRSGCQYANNFRLRAVSRLPELRRRPQY